MKLQLNAQQLRLRLDEAEFAQLLRGDSLRCETRLPGDKAWRLALSTTLTSTWQADSLEGGGLRLLVPFDVLQAYANRLPCRDGIGALLGDAEAQLSLTLEVDVRDSVRQRGVAGRKRPSEAQ